MQYWLLLHSLLLYILIISLVYSVSKSTKKKSSTVVSIDENNLDVITDLGFEERSLQQWNVLPSEALRLICTDLHINARGNRPTLARRLYEHFHNHPSLSIE